MEMKIVTVFAGPAFVRWRVEAEQRQNVNVPHAVNTSEER